VTGVALAAGLVALLGIGVVFGTDAFCALVLRPALARVDDTALTSVMGNVHRYGDARMPVPGIVGLVGSAVVAVLAALAGHGAAALLAGMAVVLLVAWLVLYARISAPINRRLTASADRGETPADARALQADWDRIIVLRACLQGAALLGVAAALVLL
jgi:hypothetical protein